MKINMHQSEFCWWNVVATAATCLLTNCLWAHPFHTTNAEMEFNPKSGRYEVSMRVLASDLEEVLTRAHFSDKGQHYLHASGSDHPPSSQVRNQRLPHNGERVNLTTTRDVDGQIITYLNQHFRITSSTANAQPASIKAATADSLEANTTNSAVAKPSRELHWVGKEFDKSWVWLYFELDAPGDISSPVLTNTVLVDLNVGQINICTVSVANVKKSLRTDAKQPSVALPPEVSSQ